MMIFTVYDSKAEAYLQPFFSQAPGVAIRNFQTAINQQDHQFHQHAADYTLFLIGEWDERTAEIRTLEAMENLGNGMNYLDKD